MFWTKASGNCFCTFLFWPVITRWCTRAVSKVVGYLHSGSSRHSAVPCQTEKVMHWMELPRIHPASRILPQSHYWSKWRNGKCHKAQISCSLAYFRRHLRLQRFHGRALLVITDPENTVRGKTFASIKKTCLRQINLLRLLPQPIFQTTFDKAEVMITLN